MQVYYIVQNNNTLIFVEFLSTTLPRSPLKRNSANGLDIDGHTPPKHPRLPGDINGSSAKGLFTDQETHTNGDTPEDSDDWYTHTN